MVVPNEAKCRSRHRFPEDPQFQAALAPARPDSIVREACLTFPSGAYIEFKETTLKSLILAVVMYEDFDTWSEQQS